MLSRLESWTAAEAISCSNEIGWQRPTLTTPSLTTNSASGARVSSSCSIILRSTFNAKSVKAGSNWAISSV